MTPIPSAPFPEEEQPKQNGQEPMPEEAEAEQPAVEPVEAEAAEEVEAVETAEGGEAAVEEMPEVPEEEAAEKAPPSKFQLLLRKVGIWTLVAVGVFLILGLLAYFQIYRPVKLNVTALEAKLASVRTELADTQADLEETQEQAEASAAELEISEARVALYQTLNGISIAQGALQQKDGQEALKALKAAQTSLNDLMPVVAQESPEAADQMDTRMKAAISSLSGDYKTTQSDLDTLTALLMQQDKLFTGK